MSHEVFSERYAYQYAEYSMNLLALSSALLAQENKIIHTRDWSCKFGA